MGIAPELWGGGAQGGGEERDVSIESPGLQTAVMEALGTTGSDGG